MGLSFTTEKLFKVNYSLFIILRHIIYQMPIWFEFLTKTYWNSKISLIFINKKSNDKTNREKLKVSLIEMFKNQTRPYYYDIECKLIHHDSFDR